MKIIKISPKSGYSHSTSKFFDFQRFENECKDFILLEGGFEKDRQWEQFDLSKDELKDVQAKKVVVIELEEPNKYFIADNPEEYEHYFYKILSICPYTTDWLNKKNNYQKRVFVFYPFNENHIPPKREKKYDIIYHGSLVSQSLIREIEIMSKFKHCLVSKAKHRLVTHSNASHEDKMNLIAESKISLVHNLLYPKPYHIFNIWRSESYKKNEAFKLVPPWYKPWELFTKKEVLVPQLKSRLFEAAFGRSLILCKKDPFNLVERFYEPEKEFVYYEEGNLETKIREVLNNFSKYEGVIENAYNRSVREYTTKAFAERYLKSLGQ